VKRFFIIGCLLFLVFFAATYADAISYKIHDLVTGVMHEAKDIYRTNARSVEYDMGSIEARLPLSGNIASTTDFDTHIINETTAHGQTSENVVSKIISRDSSGNFKAGTMDGAITGNAGTATQLQFARTIAGTAFDGSANIAIDHNGLVSIGTLSHLQLESALSAKAESSALAAYYTKLEIDADFYDTAEVDAKLALKATQLSMTSAEAAILLKANSSEVVFKSGGLSQLASAAFTELSDCPNTYVGQENKVLKVNALGTGVVFGAPGISPDEQVKTDAADPTTGYLGDKVGNSLAANLTSHIVEFVNDSAAPGNYKYYGTNGSGTRGWNDLNVSGTNEVSDATTVEGQLGSIAVSINKAARTGFDIWDSAGTYYTITGGAFRLDIGGYGFINGKHIRFNAPQTSEVLTANTTQYVYVGANGLIGITSTFDGTKINIAEVLYDGTIYQVARENHPYAMDTASSLYMHNNFGPLIRNSDGGANIGKLGTGTGGSANDRSVKLTGADLLEDHGLTVTIPDSSAAAITINYYYTNAAGKWIRYASQATVPMYYNAAGTATAIDSLKRGVFRLYVGKDTLNGSTPQYYAVMQTAQYTNLGQAQTAITTGVAAATNELAALELAQLGYIIVQNNVSSGYIEEVQVQKSTLKGTTTGSGATNIAALVSAATTNFNGILSSADTTVQQALETIDDAVYSKAAVDSAIAAATSETQAKTWYPLNMAYNDYTGEVIVDGMAASATVGQCLYLASGGWTIAKADSATTIPAKGLCVETGTGNRKVLIRGIVRNSGWSFTKGQKIYVSAATAGAITATAPSSTGQQVQIIGTALSADTVYFYFDGTYVEI